MRTVLTAAVCVAIACGCSATTEPSSSGAMPPGEVVTADPGGTLDAAGKVDEGTACAVAAASPTLTGLGAVGTPADTTYIVALSFCQLQLSAPGADGLSLSVEIITAEDVALTADIDPTTFTGSVVLQPDLGQNGHFLSLTPGVTPADEPTAGALTSANGALGITLAWAGAGGAVTFATFEQMAGELLEALP